MDDFSAETRNQDASRLLLISSAQLSSAQHASTQALKNHAPTLASPRTPMFASRSGADPPSPRRALFWSLKPQIPNQHPQVVGIGTWCKLMITFPSRGFQTRLGLDLGPPHAVMIWPQTN